MGQDETAPKPVEVPARILKLRANGAKGGRPKKVVPSREQVLVELWLNKKITVARVKALEILINELEKLPVPQTATVPSFSGATLPPWMRDDAAE